MKVEVLFIEGCAGKDNAEDMVKCLAAELGIHETTQFIMTKVTTYSQAEALKFPGSPTIRVNDVDVEPDFERYTEFGLNPRTYRFQGKEADYPDPKWVKDSMRRAKKEEDEKAMMEREKIEIASFDAKPLPRKYGMSTFKTSKEKKGAKKKGGKKKKEEEE